MRSATFITAALASTASAVAIPARATAESFTLISIDSGSSIQNAAISASDYAFWIGRGTTSSCPDSVGTSCPEGTTTALTAGQDGTIQMDVEVPGGQQLYVGPKGVLSYTSAHSADIPEGSSVQGFTYTAGASGSVGSLGFEDVGFAACPVVDGTLTGKLFQIYATVEDGKYTTNCTGISLGAVTYTGDVAAWEYN